MCDVYSHSLRGHLRFRFASLHCRTSASACFLCIMHAEAPPSPLPFPPSTAWTLESLKYPRHHCAWCSVTWAWICHCACAPPISPILRQVDSVVGDGPLDNEAVWQGCRSSETRAAPLSEGKRNETRG
ncbi:hypothetical protein LI328DRAFT_123809 [Trichoderma asperelloides]|nr:hypothetical protein LI328DRAFT_123809 [Trichoderma asperelloides]